jgi:hypothetical protein
MRTTDHNLPVSGLETGLILPLCRRPCASGIVTRVGGRIVLSFPPVSRLSSRLWQKKKHPKVNTKLDKIRKFPNPSSQGIPSRRFMRLACLPACIWRACAESYLYVLIVAGQGDPMDDGHMP